MSIDNDPNVFKLLVGIITGLFGILNIIALKLLSDLKESDRDIYKRVNEHENRLSHLEGEHKARHG